MTLHFEGVGCRAYVGCRTTVERNARGKGIVMFEVSPEGRWFRCHTATAGDNPSFLCLNAGGRVLYTVHGDRDAVSTFAVDAADGRLKARGTYPVAGRNPVHLALSPDGHWLVVACYATGNVSCLPIGEEGRLGSVVSRVSLPGEPGPIAAQQKGSHPHQVVFDPSGRWLLVPDKGTDRLHTLALEGTTGELSLVNSLSLTAGSGPRHLAFARDGRRLYLVYELGSAVAACEFDVRTGVPSPREALSTVPTPLPDNTAAGIVLASDERTLYVSNRGHDSVAVFGVDPLTRQLTSSGWLAAGGRTPRFITADPAGGVLVANEDSDSLFRIGTTAPPFPLARTGSPVCVVFAKDLS